MLVDSSLNSACGRRCKSLSRRIQRIIQTAVHIKYLIFCFALLFHLIALTSYLPPRVIEVRGIQSLSLGVILATSTSVISSQGVRAFVLNEAEKKGVNPIIAGWIVEHESQYGLRMRGDDGQSRGYWMISSVWHPEVSDACADDLKCSTAWSLDRILAGHVNEWSTWRFRFKLYPNENPPI